MRRKRISAKGLLNVPQGRFVKQELAEACKAAEARLWRLIRAGAFQFRQAKACRGQRPNQNYETNFRCLRARRSLWLLCAKKARC
jgi:hypothetical protein